MDAAWRTLDFKGGTRYNTKEFRAMLVEAGIEPETAPWKFTCPNGTVIEYLDLDHPRKHVVEATAKKTRKG
jgi:hypothetical protein